MNTHYSTEEPTRWFPNYGHLTRSEIFSLIRSDSEFRNQLRREIEIEKLLNEFNFDDDELDQEITEKPIWLPSRNRNQQKELDLKSAAISTAARSSLLSIACGTHPFSTIDNPSSLTPSGHTINTETFKEVFFNQKHLPEYKRLGTLPKLLLAQYVLRNATDAALKTYPFTFRLPTNLHGHNIQSLNKKIQRKLTSEMGRVVQFWMTYENDGYRYDQTVTHTHGEISIYLHEFKKIKQAFIKIHRSAGAATHTEPRILTRGERILKISALLVLRQIIAPIQATDGTKVKKPMPVKSIIALHVSGRNRASAQHGKFYAIFNWVSYASKQELDRKRHRFDCQIHGKSILTPNKEKFSYISASLGKLSAKFYNENISKW